MITDDKVSAHTHEHRLSREGEFIRVYFGRRVGLAGEAVQQADQADRFLQSETSHREA